jgi:hypothetical protein
MAWQKGQSGNPRGGPKDKAFADALRLAVNVEHEPDKKKLRVIAEKLVECAIGGESWAIQQVADRLDGKPAQESTVTIDDKRDSTDWSRDELVAVLNDLRKGGNGTAAPEGSRSEPDRVH